MRDAGLRILHVDNHLLVVDKPAGVPSVPDESGDESLLDRAREWIRREHGKPGRVFVAVVHRLDRPVSGVLLFARTSKAASRITAAFRQRRVRKVYWGVLGSMPEGERGTIEQWLHKDPVENRVSWHRRPTGAAKHAVTHWRLLRSVEGGGGVRVLVELEPETGRSHQLRVAMASRGTPLLGDVKYGAPEPLPDGSIALHAGSLELVHPTRGETLHLAAGPPRRAPWSSFPRGSLEIQRGR